MIDLMATVLDAAGAEYPHTYNGHEIHPLEGKSLLPTFQGRKRELHEAIFWEHEGNKAVKSGDWKLVSQYPDGWGLYSLADDRAEMRDLSIDQPGKVAELAGLWKEWRDAAMSFRGMRCRRLCRAGLDPGGRRSGVLIFAKHLIGERNCGVGKGTII